MSTSTGVAPANSIASTVAMNVWAVVITSSPGPMSSAWSASTRAAVPLPQPTATGARWNAAQAASNSATAGPPMKAVLVMTRAMAASMSGWMAAYCALRSTSGM